MRKYIAEFIGTFFLVLTAALLSPERLAFFHRWRSGQH